MTLLTAVRVLAVAAAAAGALAVCAPLALLYARDALRARASARLRARPGGIVAFTRAVAWSDGIVRPETVTWYAADGLELNRALAMVPAGADAVTVILDEPAGEAP